MNLGSNEKMKTSFLLFHLYCFPAVVICNSPNLFQSFAHQVWFSIYRQGKGYSNYNTLASFFYRVLGFPH